MNKASVASVIVWMPIFLTLSDIFELCSQIQAINSLRTVPLLPVGTCPNCTDCVTLCRRITWILTGRNIRRNVLHHSGLETRLQSRHSHRLLTSLAVAPLLLFSTLALAGKYGLKANNTHEFHKRHPHQKTGQDSQHTSPDLVHTSDTFYVIKKCTHGPRALEFSFIALLSLLFHFFLLIFLTRPIDGLCLYLSPALFLTPVLVLRWSICVTPVGSFFFYLSPLHNLYFCFSFIFLHRNKSTVLNILGNWE